MHEGVKQQKKHLKGSSRVEERDKDIMLGMRKHFSEREWLHLFEMNM